MSLTSIEVLPVERMTTFFARQRAVGLVLVGAFVMLASLLVAVRPASATICQFASVGTNDYNTAANWSCSHIPTNGDDVVIPASTSTNLSATPASSISSLSASGTLSLLGFSLTATSTLTIPSGGTVTSTGGSLTVSGAVSSTGSIGSSTGTMSFATTFQNNGTFDVGAGTATTTGALTNGASGTINGGSGTLALEADFTQGGTFTQQSGKVRLYSTAAQSIAGAVYYNFEVLKSSGTATMAASSTIMGAFTANLSGGTLSAGSSAFTAVSTTTIVAGATVTSTSGALSFESVTSSGSLGSSSGGITVSSTTIFNASGVLELGSGGATTTGALTSNVATIRAGSGRFVVLGNFIHDTTGTFSPQSGIIKFDGTATQSISGMASVNILEVTKSSGTVSTTAMTIAGTLLTSGGGTLSSLATAFAVRGASTIGSGTVVTSTSGALSFSSVTSSGSIGSSSGLITVTSTFSNNGSGLFSMGVGGASSTGVVTNNAGATIELIGAGSIWVLESGFTNSSTFRTGNSSAVYYATSSSANINVGTGVYHGIEFQRGGTFILVASTTSLGYFTITSSTTLGLGAQTFTMAVPSNGFTNNGLITIDTANGGKFVSNVFIKQITDSSGTEVESVTTTGAVYATVNDRNRNLNGTSVETLTVTLAINAAGGSDSETLTLTETATNSGVFRNTASYALVTSNVASTGNGQFELTGSGTATLTYTDNQDANDTGTDTSSFVYTAAASSGGGGGGGGGGGLAVTPVYQTISYGVTNTAGSGPSLTLVQLQALNLAWHGLVKSADDSAVYYIGADGRRHAFPNSKIYFTWYGDFSGVKVVPASTLAALPLGANVHYKPGVKMIKFNTDPKVYAIATGGKLRWVKSEALAQQLYGTTWNKMIDDMSEAFFTNYAFGADINTSAEFMPGSETTANTYISTDFGL